MQTDAIVDLYAERTDVAVRAGPLKNSSLMARKLGATRMVIVASRCPKSTLTASRSAPYIPQW